MLLEKLQRLTLLLTWLIEITASSCTPELQSSILSSIPECTVRPTLVDLRTVMKTTEDVLHLIPDHVMVDRCAGSCYIPAHRCNPVKKSVKKVPVMMVMNQWPHGEHEMVCHDVEVDVDEECACGCDLNQDDCLPDLQYFHPQSCRCLCANVEERAACIISGKVWDPASCRCHCPSHTWQACSSGNTCLFLLSWSLPTQVTAMTTPTPAPVNHHMHQQLTVLFLLWLFSLQPWSSLF